MRSLNTEYARLGGHHVRRGLDRIGSRPYITLTTRHMYVCMHVFMYVCVRIAFIELYVCMKVFMAAYKLHILTRESVCIYVCADVLMYVFGRSVLSQG